MAETASHARWKLVLTRESGESQEFFLTKPVTTVGRDSDNDIQLDDLQVSRHHFRLTQQGQRLIIEDLGTANGTQVNGTELTEPYPLQVGDTITLTTFTFLVEGQAYPYLQAGATRQLQRTPAPVPVESESSRWPWVILAVVGVCVLLMALSGLGALWFLRPGGPGLVAQATAGLAPAASAPVIIVSQAPAFNTPVQLRQSITLQAIASDPAGVTRMELWVNGQKVDQVDSSLSQHVSSMSAAFQWTPQEPGAYTLEIRAYNQPGRVGQTMITTVTAVAPDTPTLPPPPPPTETPAPLPTATPLPSPAAETPTPQPTPTQPPAPVPATATLAVPSLVLQIPAINVRSGPGTQYSILGQIERDERPEIMGQADVGQGRWWQIRFDPSPDNLGWVTADEGFTSALNSDNVPRVSPPRLVAAVPTVTVPPTALPTPAPTATSLPEPAALPAAVVQAPPDKMLLIVNNRSQTGTPARLTLSGGRSVGGGQELDPPPNGQIELLLEPDFYRALWSSPMNNFTRGADFTAVPGRVMVMWIVPEDGVTMAEWIEGAAPAEAPVPEAIPAAAVSTPERLTAPPGKAILIIENRSVENEFAYLTMSEGTFGGGYALTVDAGTHHTFEIIPAHYRTTWSAPAGGGMSMNREFTIKAGDIVVAWVVPEKREVVFEPLSQ